MATRLHSGVWLSRGVHEATWGGLLNTDDGDPLDAAALSDKSVHVFGTPGVGGTIVIEGSNSKLSWVTLSDPQGNPLSFTAEAIEALLENVKWVRPRVTAGDATTNFSVVLISRSSEL